eukprot:1536691-Lingulodinium_polyedra.AAC.1
MEQRGPGANEVGRLQALQRRQSAPGLGGDPDAGRGRGVGRAHGRVQAAVPTVAPGPLLLPRPAMRPDLCLLHEEEVGPAGYVLGRQGR